MLFAVTCVCVSRIMLKYIVPVDRCAARASPGGTLHMCMCIISPCKSAIVSPYTSATQNSPVLNLVHVLVVCICLTRQSCHYDDPRVNKLHNSRQHTQTVLLLFFDHLNYDCFVKSR